MAGVHIRPGSYGGEVARVLITLEGDKPGKVITELVVNMPQTPTFDVAAE